MGPDPAIQTPPLDRVPEGSPRRATARATPWWCALIACWIVALGAVYAHIPPSPDQDELDYVAERMNAGGTPYVDVIDMNWPGSVWMHQLARLIPEGRAHPWRIVDYLLILIGAWGVWGVLARAPPDVRLGAAALYPLLAITAGGAWFVGQRDAIIGHLALAAAAATLKVRNSPAWVGVAGLVIGCAVLIKPTAILFAPAIGAFVVGRAVASKELKRGALCIVAAGLAGAVTLALALGITLAQGSGLDAIRACLIDYNVVAQNFETMPLADLAGVFITEHARSWHWICLVALFGLIVLARHPNTRPHLALLALLWAAATGTLIWQGKGYTYHLAPGFSILAAVALAGVVGLIQSWRVGGLKWVALGGLALAAIGTATKLAHLRRPAMYAARALDRATYLDAYLAGDGLTRAQADEVVAWLDTVPVPGSAIYLWGSANSINLLADRPQCTRFYYAPVLENTRPPLPATDEWLASFDADLRGTPPAACLIDRPRLDKCMEANPPVAARVNRLLENYTLVRTIGQVELYEPATD